MINFGVREVADSKATAAPGWAYVPDTGVNTSVSALQPARNKRQRTQLAPNQHETTAKQDAKILRELTALDRESHREVLIPVPVRHRDCAGRGMAFFYRHQKHLLTATHGHSKPWKSYPGSSQDLAIAENVCKSPSRL
jgi:hypothetical protein